MEKLDIIFGQHLEKSSTEEMKEPDAIQFVKSNPAIITSALLVSILVITTTANNCIWRRILGRYEVPIKVYYYEFE